MTIAPRDYLPEPEVTKVPPELAIMIIRKAEAMARKFENDCMDTMTRTARRLLAEGVDVAHIARHLNC